MSKNRKTRHHPGRVSGIQKFSRSLDANKASEEKKDKGKRKFRTIDLSDLDNELENLQKGVN